MEQKKNPPLNDATLATLAHVCYTALQFNIRTFQALPLLLACPLLHLLYAIKYGANTI